MNISLTNVDSVHAILQLNIAQEDYKEKVDQALKNFRKKASVPGFRPGTVPAGMVKKMYGKSIVAEEVNKLVGEHLYNYIKENNLNILGEPLTNEEKQQPVDFAAEGDFEFFFDLALAPEIKLNLSKKDSVPYYKIDVEKKLVDQQIDSYKANYGKYEQVEEGTLETDLIKGRLQEVDAKGEVKEGGITVEDAVVMASYMKDDAEKAKFADAKVGDVIAFNPGKAYEGNEAEIASLLQIQKEDLGTLPAEFRFEVKEITRYKEARLGKELYAKVFGEDVEINNKEEFEDKVKEAISTQFAPDSDYKFLLDAKDMLVEKVGKLAFPDALLKKWLLTSSEERTAEDVEADYPKIIEDLTFHLIKEQIAKDHEVKIENEDVKYVAMQTARAQFAQYGMMGLPEQMIENYANDLLKKEENTRNLVDRAMENKLIGKLKEILTVKEEKIELDEFRKFFETETPENEAEEVE